jgi:selenocysteine-specific elongation factor
VRVVATAGHVDHGKSTLVLALTGTDPDRFPEEKARGLTIDLGFAFTAIGDDEVGFVDVPGHIRFIKNMLAGVGAVEVAMLVVAANEGWKPQTEEHARILELLGVRHGLVVLTKADLVDADELELAELELGDRLEGGALADWPVVVVDAVSGRGVDDVRAALARVLATAPAAADRGRPRLWIDRAFAARGAGTVVTGTLGGGSLAVDDEVVVEPSGRRARVRGIESHHERLTRVAPGARVAVNLAGVEHGEVRRGDALVLPGQWWPVVVLDAELTMVPGEDELARRVMQAHVGSGVYTASVRVLDDPRFVRVRLLGTHLPLAPGDRLVLRSSARRTTVAGATVLDVAPTRRAADAPARLVRPLGERVLSARPWSRADEVAALAGLDLDRTRALLEAAVDDGHASVVGVWTVANDARDALVVRAVDIVEQHRREHPVARGIDLAVLASRVDLDLPRLRALLDTDDRLRVERDSVQLASTDADATLAPDAQRFLDALVAAPFAPPAPAELGVGSDVVRVLVKDGAIVALDGIYFAADAIEEARRRVSRALLERTTLKLADIRDLLDSSRKFVVPIATRLDTEGITRRRGDDRIAGPRAADYSSGG